MRKNIASVIDAFHSHESYTDRTCGTDGAVIRSYELVIAARRGAAVLVLDPAESPSRTTTSQIRAVLAVRPRTVLEIGPGSGVFRRYLEHAGVTVKTLDLDASRGVDYVACAQRSAELKASVEWLELVRFAEDNASSEVWALLKRPDEKWITERAYENPKFVEDLVRDVALALNADARIGRYCVEVENHESIHNHAAYARIERA
jgi:GTP cyclohydrolase I